MTGCILVRRRSAGGTAMRRMVVTGGVAAGIVAAMIVGLCRSTDRGTEPRGEGVADMGARRPDDEGAGCRPTGASGDKSVDGSADGSADESLTPEERRVMRCGGTESPFSGEHWDRKDRGLYRCAACGGPLFKSSAKYDSGTGWPSFFEPVAAGNVTEKIDRSRGTVRTEVVCSGCGAHLGHVFDDGPPPTGRRYCVNSVALRFEPEAGRTERAMFAAGCFWGVEAAFGEVEGVVDTAVGYSGGAKADPTYEEVCTGTTGHAEVVLVTYDPTRVSFRELIKVFWRIHDPTQRNRQGPDVGRQYRSGVFCMDEGQRREAEASRDALARSGKFKKPIATEVAAAGAFYRAEEYHQRYHEKHGDRGCAIR